MHLDNNVYNLIQVDKYYLQFFLEMSFQLADNARLKENTYLSTYQKWINS